MEKVSVLEGKIKRLKKTISELGSGTEDQAEYIQGRTFRKQLKRLQRRRSVILSTAASFKKGKGSTEKSPEVEKKTAAPEETPKNTAGASNVGEAKSTAAAKKKTAVPDEKPEIKTAVSGEGKAKTTAAEPVTKQKPAEAKEEPTESGN